MVTGVVDDDVVPDPLAAPGSPTPGLSDAGTIHASSTETHRRWVAAGALVVIVGFGVFLRAHGFSSLGLWRDDAWVALSAKVGLGSAWHMWVTAPGAFFVERTALVLGPGGATWWAQLPAFVAGVAAIPAAYFLVRWFRLSRTAGLFVAAFIAVAPACVVYSTRVKEYELDILLACLVLALGEWARRNPGRRQLAAVALASVAAFFCSASLAPVVAGVWLALALFAWREGPGSPRRCAAAAGAAAAAGCGVIALLFYTHISPTTRLLWPGAFIRHGSPAAFFSSLESTSWNLLQFPFGFGQFSLPVRVVLVMAWLAVMAAGLYRNRAMVAPALVLAAAYLASAATLDPLGTGRTDEYLYPALLLLTVSGATRLARTAAPTVRRLTPLELLTLEGIGVIVLVLVTLLRVGEADAIRPTYPGVDVTGLIAQIHAHEEPGDHIFVSELMRFPWALAEEPAPDLRFGSGWATGFTVVSTQPDVFLVPSEHYEEDSHPKAWAAEMAGDRLWYVWSPPLSVDPSYRALRQDGWRPVTTLHAPGSVATLLER
jgi:hypothetical protein